MRKILKPVDSNVTMAVKSLLADELIAFPTETVYGLGGNAYSDKAVAEIFRCKNRQKFNPLSVCYLNLEDVADDVEINETAFTLSNHFLPGPLTIILKRSVNSRLSMLCSAGMDTVAVRIPANRIARDLLSKLSFPLAAPSANESTLLSPTTAQAVLDGLKHVENLTILDGGRCSIGIESTILDLTSEKIRIRRIGAVSVEEICKKCGFSLEKEQILPVNATQHYRTNKKIVLNAINAKKDDALLAFGRPFENQCRYVLNLSANENLEEAAANLFAMLRQLDKTNAKRICVMPILEQKIGIAINDILKKASATGVSVNCGSAN